MITCADSRVSPEILFDVGLGDVFVVRVAGAVANTDQVGSVEYAVGHLDVPLLVVLGHSKCGAVAAVVRGEEVEGNIPDAVKNIDPVVRRVKAAQGGVSVDALIAASIEANTWQTVDDVFRSSPILREGVAAGKLRVVGAIYDLDSGGVKWLGTHPEQTRLLAYTDGPTAHGAEGTSAGLPSHAATPTEESVATHGASAPHATSAPTGVPQPGSAHESAAPVQVESHALLWLIGTPVLVGLLMAGAFFAARSSTMKRLTVPVRLAFGFGAILAVLCALGGVGYFELHATKNGFEEFSRDADHSNIGAKIQEHATDMELATRDWALHRSASTIQSFDSHLNALDEVLAAAERTITEPDRQQMVQKIKQHAAEYSSLFAQLWAMTIILHLSAN